MPNRHSEINNCPDCRERLWLRKRNGILYYNCLRCGYQAVIEQPQPTKQEPKAVQLDFWDDLAIAAHKEDFET